MTSQDTLSFCKSCGLLVRDNKTETGHLCDAYTLMHFLNLAIKCKPLSCPIMDCHWYTFQLSHQVEHLLNVHNYAPLYGCSKCCTLFVSYTSKFYHELLRCDTA